MTTMVWWYRTVPTRTDEDPTEEHDLAHSTTHQFGSRLQASYWQTQATNDWRIGVRERTITFVTRPDNETKRAFCYHQPHSQKKVVGFTSLWIPWPCLLFAFSFAFSFALPYHDDLQDQDYYFFYKYFIQTYLCVGQYRCQ